MKSNYSTQSAYNGKEALTAMQQASYDVVLVDIFMPIMDGIECTKELRRLGFKCPIIAVSATINEEACLNAGVTSMLHKPITKATVLAAIEKALALPMPP